MPKVDIINFKIKSSTMIYLFTLVMTNKSIIIDNIDVFKELNVNQVYLRKILNLKSFLPFARVISKLRSRY